MHLFHRLSRCAAAALIFAMAGGTLCRGEEPYERFLQKLQDAQLYDLALAYLEGLQDKPGVSDEFRAAIDLERAMLLYRAAAQLPADHPDRARKLDEAEAALRNFLQTRPNHPRRGEARMKLGELLMSRGEEALRNADPGGQSDVPDAIRFYDEAHKVFEQTIAELAQILDTLKGARVDPSDTEKVAYRRQIQQQIREAQLLSAVAVKERGHARRAGPQREADLRKAVQMLADLYSKETYLAGIRYYALFYRSQIQRELGQNNDAIDGFQRIADLERADPLRPLQMQAVRELVELLAAEGKYPLAIERGESWVKNLRPDERGMPEAIELQLALYKARLAWAEQLKAQDPDDRVASRLIRDTRADLRSLLRVPGPHLPRVQELLAELGIQPGGDNSLEEVPQVTTFAEAMTAAQERIDASETESLALEVLREKGDVQAAQQVERKVELLRRQALQLLQRSLALFSPQDDRDQLYDARLRMAFLLLKLNEPMPSLAIAEHLVWTHPRSDRGLRAASIALGGLSDLLRTAGPQEKQALAAHMEPLAEFLVSNWPDSTEAAAASAALVQLALMNKQLDKVEQYLRLVPAEGETALKLRRDVGLSMYIEYLQLARQGGDDSPDARAMRDKALATLEPVIQQLRPEAIDEGAIEALNAYCRLLLAAGRTDQALDLLLKDAKSPLQALSNKPDAAAPRIAMETYRTAISATIAGLTEGKIDNAQAIAQTKQYIEGLQRLAARTDDGNRVLAGIFVGLAKDTTAQLENTTDPTVKQRLSEALALVAGEAARSESFNTQFWAVETIIDVADQLLQERRAASTARESLARAATIIEQMLAKEKQTPGWIDPPALQIKLRLLLAKALRLQGQFKQALDQLSAVLQENQALLDVQLEAARVYQDWGDAKNAGFHRAAILGGRPIQPGRNLIWGFGKISQMTAGKPQFESQFFEARYQLARSRYKYALSLQDPETKKKELEKAIKDITSTAALYPELGGPAMRRKFDALLREIQKAAGQAATGLAAVPAPAS